MMENETQRLLKDFSRERSEGEFRELVRTHSPVVYGTAIRMLAGDRAAAEDVTQEVFTLLARKAGSLGDVILSAWLYRQTCRRAANHVRAESRRRKRELVAANMMTHPSTEPADDPIRGEVDAALLALPSSDRDALVLRYFEGQNFRKLGTTLGTTEEAARKRVTRAIEKLSAALRKRGIAVGGASLGATMTNLGATPVPSSLVAQVTAHAMKAAPLAGDSWTMNLLKPFVAGVLASSLVAGSVLAVQSRRAAAPPASVERKDARSSSPRSLSKDSSPEDLIAEIKRIHAGPRHALTTLRLSATLERITIDRMPDFFLLAHEKLTPAEQAECFDLLLERWVQADPDAALTFMIDHPLWKEVNAERSTSLINNIFEQWMRSDLPASRAWLLAQWQAGALREEAFEATLGEFLAMEIADKLLIHDSASASFSFVASLPGEDERQRTLFALTGGNSYLGAWLNIDAARFRDVLQEIQKLDDPVLGGSLAAAMWQKILGDRPEEAKRLDALLTPKDRFARDLGELGVHHRRAHTTAMTGGGYRSDFESVEPAAMDDRKLIETGIAAGLTREEVLKTVASTLANQRDRKRAFDWIDTYRAEVSFDDFLRKKLRELGGPVTGWSTGDTPYARIIEWASRLSDEEAGRAICRGAFRRLQHHMPKEVPGFLERKDIPAAILEELRQLAETAP